MPITLSSSRKVGEELEEWEPIADAKDILKLIQEQAKAPINHNQLNKQQYHHIKTSQELLQDQVVEKKRKCLIVPSVEMPLFKSHHVPTES
jgi:ubiquitin-protein ligase